MKLIDLFYGPAYINGGKAPSPVTDRADAVPAAAECEIAHTLSVNGPSDLRGV